MLNHCDVALVTTSPHNFAGAATAHARAICLLSHSGYEVHYVTLGESFHLPSLQHAHVHTTVPALRSDAYPTSDTLQAAAAVQALVSISRDAAKRNKKVVLLATFVHPYVGMIINAARILRREGISAAVIAQPAGSDIWQIGAQVPDCTMDILSSIEISSVVSFSRRFSSEIQEHCGAQSEPIVIPPAVDTAQFAPLSPQERANARHQLGIHDDETVLLACSNMRPVKGLGVLVAMSQAVAARHGGHVSLLLVGPITQHLRDVLRVHDVSVNGEPCTALTHNLTLRVVGLQHDTTIYHQVSDIAINASYHDSFNISLAESMACGLPVVSSDVVGLADVIRSTHSGLLYSYASIPLERLRTDSLQPQPVADIEGTSQRICELLRNTQRLRELGERGRNAILTVCSPAQVRRQWVQLIRRVVEPG